MSRSPEGPDSDLLFDLPLDPAPSEESASRVSPQAPGPSPPAVEEYAADQEALDFSPEGAVEVDPPALKEASLGARFVAGALDLVVLVAVLALALLTIRLQEIPMGIDTLAPLGIFLLTFSFLYHVVPLAFWAHTPGMAYSRILSRDKDGEFLTIRQCILRWLGWALTIATGGLACLIALSGVSLTDLLSSSRLFRRPS